MKHLSQFNEAEIIQTFFNGRVGKFIDIGASSGVSLSNTFELGLLGWHGLFVEASPTHFANLLTNYIHRGGFQFINGAFWTEHKLMKFHYNPYFYSSLIHKDEPGLFTGSFHVRTVTAKDLLELQPTADFISLDIEGADVHVFPSLIEAYPNVRLVCVEHAKNPSIKQKWNELFARFRFKIIAETPENYIASKKA